MAAAREVVAAVREPVAGGENEDDGGARGGSFPFEGVEQTDEVEVEEEGSHGSGRGAPDGRFL